MCIRDSLEAAAPRPAALSPPSAQSSPRRPLALRVLCPVREPSSTNPHGHHPQARHPAALASCVQGFQISIPLLLESKETAQPGSPILAPCCCSLKRGVD